MQHPRQMDIVDKQRLPGEQAWVFVAFDRFSEERVDIDERIVIRRFRDFVIIKSIREFQESAETQKDDKPRDNQPTIAQNPSQQSNLVAHCFQFVL